MVVWWKIIDAVNKGPDGTIRNETVVVIRLWRGNSKLDGEYSRVIEDVNRGRFYELAYSEKKGERISERINPYVA